MNHIVDIENANIWKNNINNIINNDDLIILYKWIYNKNSNTWSIHLYEKFSDFVKKNDNISVADTFIKIKKKKK